LLRVLVIFREISPVSAPTGTVQDNELPPGATLTFTPDPKFTSTSSPAIPRFSPLMVMVSPAAALSGITEVILGDVFSANAKVDRQKATKIVAITIILFDFVIFGNPLLLNTHLTLLA